MSKRGRVIVGVVGAALLASVWVARRYGAFTTPEDLDKRAEALDAGVPEGWPFDAGDASMPEGGAPGGEVEEAPAVNVFSAIGGTAVIGLRNFTMRDKRDRQVLRIKNLTGEVNLDELQRGIYRVSHATIEGAEITLHRDKGGELSITSALREEPRPVKRALYVPPEEEPKGEDWLIDVGPVSVRDSILTLGFTAKPVRFYIERAKAMVRRTAEDEAPKIYLHDVQGRMLEPDPLPKPVRIAQASGIVRLGGAPMVELTARTCVGNAELRVHAVVPARKKPVRLTVDSAGIGGALGRMGLKIAARRKEEKLQFQHGPVKIDGGPGCEYEKGERRELKAENDTDEKNKDAADKPERASPEAEPQERREKDVDEEREDRQEKREDRQEDRQEDKRENEGN